MKVCSVVLDDEVYGPSGSLFDRLALSPYDAMAIGMVRCYVGES